MCICANLDLNASQCKVAAVAILHWQYDVQLRTENKYALHTFPNFHQGDKVKDFSLQAFLFATKHFLNEIGLIQFFLLQKGWSPKYKSNTIAVFKPALWRLFVYFLHVCSIKISKDLWLFHSNLSDWYLLTIMCWSNLRSVSWSQKWTRLPKPGSRRLSAQIYSNL